jgi:DNA-directed RNA polymerase subunit alpha
VQAFNTMFKNHSAQCSFKRINHDQYLVVVSPLEIGVGHILGFTLQCLTQDVESIKIDSLKLKMGSRFNTPDTNTDSYMDITIDELILNLSDIYVKEEGEYVIDATEEGIYDISTLHTLGIKCLNTDNQFIFTKISNRPMTIYLTAKMYQGYHLPKEVYVDSQKTFFLHVYSSPFFLKEYIVKEHGLGLANYEQLELRIRKKTNESIDRFLENIADKVCSVFQEEIKDLIHVDQTILLEQTKSEESNNIAAEQEVLKYTLDQVHISARSFNCLQKASIFTVKDLIAHTEQSLLNVPHFGIKCLSEIKTKLNDLNLSLKSADI